MKGPCKCRPETRSVSCWNMDLLSLSSEQILPRDVRTMYINYFRTKNILLIRLCFRDLGRNSLSTLNAATFKSLIYLTEIDLFDNRLDYLPESVFDQLDSAEYL